MKLKCMLSTIALVGLGLMTVTNCTASKPTAPPAQQVAFAAEQGDVALTAQAAQGWLFYGWARDNNANGQWDDDGTEPILSLNEKYTGCLTPQGNYDTKEKAEADSGAAKVKDTYIAIFTAAKAQFAPAQQQGGIGLMGSITTSKPVNAPGDKVTFTATPFEGHAFKNWTDANGSVAGTNPVLTITAKGGELYTANFQ